MPEGRRALRPLLLRRERFGGILFDSEDGTHAEVDPEAFAFLCDWLISHREPASGEERELRDRLLAELPGLGSPGRECRLAPDRSAAVPAYRNATVLGAPTLVDLQLTNRCRMGCPHCYASSSPSGADIPYEDVLEVLEGVAAAGVFQLALGGGEPLLHPELPRILRAARDLGIVPNLTTTGDGLTEEALSAMAECCGAVALSLEGVGEEFDRRRRPGFAFFQNVHARLRERGIPTVFQVTLSVENLPGLPAIVDHALGCPDLYGVIFLAYKPVGRGTHYQTPLSGMSASALFPQLRDAFVRLAAHTRVGYDCCLTPGIAGLDRELGQQDDELLEGCSAMRKSVGVATNLDVVPCTFLTHRPVGNLREQSLVEIWQGERADAFRRAMDRIVDVRPECRGCRCRTGCLGGCPEWRLVGCRAAELQGPPVAPPSPAPPSAARTVLAGLAGWLWGSVAGRRSSSS